MPAAPSPTSASRTGGPRTCPSPRANGTSTRSGSSTSATACRPSRPSRPAQLDYWRENSAKAWATAYDFDAVKRGLVKMEQLPDRQASRRCSRSPSTCAARSSRTRACGSAFNLAFDFEWANKNLFYDQYTRVGSYFDNSELKATGLPQGRELEILNEVQGPGAARGLHRRNGRTRSTPRREDARKHLSEAAKLLAEAGWHAEGRRAHQRRGRAAHGRVPAGAARLRAHRAALQGGAGAGSASRPACASSTPRSISAAHDTFDFDIIVASFPQSNSPGNEQRDFWGSEAADKEGSRNVIGIKNPADRQADRQDHPGQGSRRSWSPPRARSTACCCGTTTSCRSGTRRSSAWPCGTCSAARPSCRRATSSFLRVWWYDEAAAKRLADGAGLDRCAARPDDAG